MKYTFYQPLRRLCRGNKKDLINSARVRRIMHAALLSSYGYIKFCTARITPQMPNILCCRGGIVRKLLKEVWGHS